jgi:transcription initiation factor TFIIE subunit alpha
MGVCQWHCPIKNMRISNNIIEYVVKELVGEDAIPLVNFLKNNKNISEFKIAEVIKKEVNSTRNMLYRLYENNLVSFIRKKDKKKGWYIYYWTFNQKRVKDLIVELKKKKFKKLKERITREEGGNFFGCKNKCIRLDFDQATDFTFKCPECGSVLDQEDNKKVIEDIHKEIKDLEKEMKTLK